MSVAYNKIQPFVANLANGKYNLGSDTLAVALTDVAPTAGLVKLGDLTQISYTNLSSRSITVTASTQTSGTYKLVANQLTLTASGTVPQFRYVVLYDSAATNYELIAWYDYGSEVNMNSGDTFVVGFDLTNGVLQIV